MARVVVLSSPALADGYRLAGATVVEVPPGPAGAAALRTVIAEPDTGLALVTADIWSALDERDRAGCERLAQPIVLAVPAGRVTESAARRLLIGEMLEHAIGYRIELSGSGTR